MDTAPDLRSGESRAEGLTWARRPLSHCPSYSSVLPPPSSPVALALAPCPVPRPRVLFPPSHLAPWPRHSVRLITQAAASLSPSGTGSRTLAHTLPQGEPLLQTQAGLCWSEHLCRERGRVLRPFAALAPTAQLHSDGFAPVSFHSRGHPELDLWAAGQPRQPGRQQGCLHGPAPEGRHLRRRWQCWRS